MIADFRDMSAYASSICRLRKLSRLSKMDLQLGRRRSTLVDGYVDDNLVILGNISESEDLQLARYLRGEQD
jgi:hypothetical protein